MINRLIVLKIKNNLLLNTKILKIKLKKSKKQSKKCNKKNFKD